MRMANLGERYENGNQKKIAAAALASYLIYM
jgi:hypothetical protein